MKGQTLTLSKTRTGNTYVITECNATGRERARLDSLGLVVGQTVHVLSSSYAGLILDIKGSRLAICKDVANRLTVT
jgi:Fe2+ transport system protein FeoA